MAGRQCGPLIGNQQATAFGGRPSRRRCRPAAWGLTLVAFMIVGLAALTALPGCGPESVPAVPGRQVPPPPPVATPMAEVPLVHVKLGDDESWATVTVRGAYQIYDCNAKKLVMEGQDLVGSVVSTCNGQLTIDNKALGTERLEIVPCDEGSLEIGPRRYRGNLRLVARGNCISLINVVTLERYLYSVVGEETYRSWQLETLKAQAVAARTYALYHMKLPMTPEFDLFDSPGRSQAYSGLATETEKSRRAVDETGGLVLACTDSGGQDRIFEALFSSTCGGRTVAVQEQFPNFPPVKSLSSVECTYCRNSKFYNWTAKMSAEELRSKLSRNVRGMEGLNRITAIGVEPGDRTSSGTVRAVRIWSTGKKTLCWPVSDDILRRYFPNIRSNRFSVTAKGNEIIFKGRGFGHGVGLCQFGAEQQAATGRRAEGILRFYYTDSKLVKVY